MFDGVKILDLSISTNALLQNDRLTFPLPIDERTGAIINQPRRATEDGLIFTIIPRKSGDSRCELKGSLHRYFNNGQHNANDFTVANLLKTISYLVTTYDIDPYASQLNNVEFGVNIRLPFPVAEVLDRLICYQGVPFVRDTDNSGLYYQASLSQYAVKIYDKGKQYGVAGNILRVELKVFRMRYLTAKGIHLNTITDLLNDESYSRLGKLLIDTFTNILFDEPTINAKLLSVKDHNLLINGRNARYWHLAARETFKDDKEYNRQRKRLQRQEKRFRALLDIHRQPEDWLSLTTELIRTKWEKLTTVSPVQLAEINNQMSMWRGWPLLNQKRPNITGLLNSDAD